MASTTPSPSIFLTGATGFVGGSILSSLVRSHPNAHIKALVRKETDARELQSFYPNLEPIIGTLSSLSLLATTAASVDFVVHAAGDSIPAAQAMIDGLASSSTRTVTNPLPRLISLTGPRSLIDRSIPVTGDADNRCWSDIADARTILSLPKERMHAEADQALVSYSTTKGVGTMLISPGQLWGRGKGIRKEASSAMYYAAVKRRGRAFVIGDGSATWSWVSINDVADAVVFLMQQAMQSGSKGAAAERIGVNDEGYYFVQCQDLSMRERAEAVSKRLGLGEIESISAEAAAEIHPFGPIMWGCGARFRADKLSKLGWRPKETDWRALMEEEGGERA